MKTVFLKVAENEIIPLVRVRVVGFVVGGEILVYSGGLLADRL